MRPFFWLGLVLLAAVGACSDDGSSSQVGLPGPDGGHDAPPEVGPSPPALTGLEVEPTRVQLSLVGTSTPTQAFTVFAVLSDGTRTEVTAEASFTVLDDRLGTMADSTFVPAGVGGQTRIRVAARARFAEATVTLDVSGTLIAPPADGQPDLPEGPDGVFDQAPQDPSRAPTLVYPNDGVLLPPNLGSVEVHYVPASAADTLFELRFESPRATFAVYTRCTRLAEGCVYEVAGRLWEVLAETNRGRSPVTVTVRATDDEGTGVGSSASFQLRYALEDVIGGIYYWTTSDGTGIMRTEFGSPEPPERFFPFSGGGCFGCHALSRDGQRMTVSQNGQRDGRVTLVDVRRGEAIAGPRDDFREQFQSWAPDSDRFAGIWADGDPVDTNIRIRDGDTGEILETIALGFEPSHPDWSPVGDRIVFTRVTRHQTSQRPGRGGLSYVAHDGSGWGDPVELMPPVDGKNRYYPAYSPDGSIVVFNESICPGGGIYSSACDADADEVAKLWAIAADGGEPVLLSRANAPGVGDEGETDLSNTFPKWAPFEDVQRADGGRELWFTFSSRRQYGLRAPNGSDQLLWMAALDPDQVSSGSDGSFVAFALPFQDLGTSNHIAQWTTRIVPVDPDPPTGNDGGVCLELGQQCEPGQCCPPNVCQSGVCAPDF